MKKLITLLVVLISCFPGFSQVNIGIKAGANVSTVVAEKFNIQAEYEEFEKPRLGYYVGAYTGIDLSNKISFRPELLFSLKGYRTISSDTYLDVRGNRRLYYLNLPLLISYRPSAKFAVVIGPELGLLLRAESKHSTAFGNSGNYQPIEGYDRGDYGLALGFNYDLLPGLSFDLRFTQGFNELTNFRGLDDTRNRALKVGLAYNLLKK